MYSPTAPMRSARGCGPTSAAVLRITTKSAAPGFVIFEAWVPLLPKPCDPCQPQSFLQDRNRTRRTPGAAIKSDRSERAHSSKCHAAACVFCHEVDLHQCSCG